jgi:hypothetical protein
MRLPNLLKLLIKILAVLHAASMFMSNCMSNVNKVLTILLNLLRSRTNSGIPPNAHKSPGCTISGSTFGHRMNTRALPQHRPELRQHLLVLTYGGNKRSCTTRFLCKPRVPWHGCHEATWRVPKYCGRFRDPVRHIVGPLWCPRRGAPTGEARENRI